jgi:hypothetical protein
LELEVVDRAKLTHPACAAEDIIPPISAVKMYMASPSVSGGPAAIYKYRSKARVTYTNMLPLAANQ